MATTAMTVVLVGMNRHSSKTGAAPPDSMEKVAYVPRGAVPVAESVKLPRIRQAAKTHFINVELVNDRTADPLLSRLSRTRDPKIGRSKVLRRPRKGSAPVTVRVVEVQLREKLREGDELLRNTARALAEVLQHTDPGLEASPEVARSVQASENRWRTIASEYKLLDSRAVDELLGGSGTNRNRAHQLAKEGKIIGVKRGRGTVYPGFEFEHGAVRPVISELAAIGRRSSWSDAHLIMWMASPNGYLEGRVPARMLDQPDKVLEAARQDLAERW